MRRCRGRLLQIKPQQAVPPASGTGGGKGLSRIGGGLDYRLGLSSFPPLQSAIKLPLPPTCVAEIGFGVVGLGVGLDAEMNRGGGSMWRWGASDRGPQPPTKPQLVFLLRSLLIIIIFPSPHFFLPPRIAFSLCLKEKTKSSSFRFHSHRYCKSCSVMCSTTTIDNERLVNYPGGEGIGGSSGENKCCPTGVVGGKVALDEWGGGINYACTYVGKECVWVGCLYGMLSHSIFPFSSSSDRSRFVTTGTTSCPWSC